MIISYTHPYELTQTPMFADTEKDFEKIPVKSSGYIESNKFYDYPHLSDNAPKGQ